MIRTWALFAVLISGALIDVARASRAFAPSCALGAAL
jgi:hypothetical protein